jgi:hypothetical protein
MTGLREFSFRLRFAPVNCGDRFTLLASFLARSDKAMQENATTFAKLPLTRRSSTC